jgi:hypothetical protein
MSDFKIESIETEYVGGPLDGTIGEVVISPGGRAASLMRRGDSIHCYRLIDGKLRFQRTVSMKNFHPCERP